MATIATPAPQQDLVEELVKTVRPPQGVRLQRVYFDTDSTGDPAIRVIFANSLSLPLSKPRVRTLANFSSVVRDTVNAAWADYFTYVTFREVK